jgi:predicted ATP-dependent serine protease
MAKPKTIYSCTECGGQSPKVAGAVPALQCVEHTR